MFIVSLNVNLSRSLISGILWQKSSEYFIFLTLHLNIGLFLCYNTLELTWTTFSHLGSVRPHGKFYRNLGQHQILFLYP